MKKSLIIATIFLIILLIGGAWMYIFIYGKPKNTDEMFARFGLGGENPDAALNLPTDPVPTEEEVPLRLPKLRQLSTRPVAGAYMSENEALFVEQGTGHIYSVHTETNTETIVSGTTVPGTSEAIFSEDGTYVALTTYSDNIRQTTWGRISGDASGLTDTRTLPAGAYNVSFDTRATGTIFYTEETQGGATGYAQSDSASLPRQLFSIPLRDITVLWGTPTYVYTTPSRLQLGYIYTVQDTRLTSAGKFGFGLSAFRHNNEIIRTILEKNEMKSYIIEKSTTDTPLIFPAIPEKCVTNDADTDTIFCAVPFEPQDKSYPDSWYKGTTTYRDILWLINTNNGSARLISDLLEESGREIDVDGIFAREDGGAVIFINKNDNTLFIFDGIREPAEENNEEPETASSTEPIL